jgi:RimJ/RimL family protein N-acetyltransferase
MAKLKPATFETKNGIQLIIRSIEAEDAAEFLIFRNQIPYDTTNTMQYVGMQFPPIGEIAKRLETQSADSVILNIGAFDENKLVGFLNFRLESPDHPWVQHLAQFGMMILKDYWGLGIGKELLRLQDIHAKAQSITRIEAKVRVANERGVRLYQSNGFDIEGTRKRAANINGEFHDEYFIAKILG